MNFNHIEYSMLHVSVFIIKMKQNYIILNELSKKMS